ncbi:MAG TPA: EscU/YscU/HrcU family type III secretion system export apparatus switch protein [Arenimonas sp.]|uniref:EscU/YscU/HrcU family type III secretion system export apparatus switch protein n=1 Tax=Arenimonas sp. TaxID=1872635 RepID=UPI002D80406B|nr:EscU/YscU/HrcU family type III secretion system export apparatus switch protein [Arenimonas sp.]HEU0153496.1 EscU/YscU/HrcU family type III secretion system export apparatus switch protein [Arenimonas sp.]
MSQEDKDKTEEPTQYKLDEARKKGEVAKSAELVGAGVAVVFAATVAITGGGIAVAAADATRATLQLAGARPAISPALLPWLAETYAPLWQALTPLALAMVVVAVVANVMQTGPMFTTHPISPDFKRMNPANAFKRIFSMRSLWELGKSGLKLGFLSLVCFLVAKQALGLVGGVALGLPARLPQMLQSAFVTTSIYVLLVLALMAVLDWLFVRRDFTRKMRMSRRDLRDEHKRRDGDPEVKNKQKRLIRDLLKKTRAVPRVGDADVVLTNPTHVAVALKYRPRTMRAPIVLAKGAGFLAARIRSVAARKGVPIQHSPALARALYRECDIDGPVPESLYGELAPIYRRLLGGNLKERIA